MIPDPKKKNFNDTSNNYIWALDNLFMDYNLSMELKYFAYSAVFSMIF